MPRRTASLFAAVVVSAVLLTPAGAEAGKPPKTTTTTRPTTTTTTTVPSLLSLVSSFTPAVIRNDFSGRVGMRIAVGTADITARGLGRSVLAGNAGTHALSLLNVSGTVLATASVNMYGQQAGTFAYADLAAPVVLKAGSTYFVMSEETIGGDTWFDYNTRPVTTAAAKITAAAYATGSGAPLVGANAVQAYGLVNLQYSTGSSAPAPTTTTTTTVADRTIPLTETAIRTALGQGGVIRLPAGTVNITKPLRVTKSGTKLIGAGRGATVLRMAFGAGGYGPLLAIPAEWSTDFGGGNPPPPTMRVSDVEIAHLSIDGAREGHPNTYGAAQTTTLRFGVQSTVSTNTWLHDLHVHDVAGDAIAFGNGSGVNVNPVVEDVVIERAGRNGLHLGSSDGAVIRRIQVLDTPGPYWSDAGAGNGLDIEVEGADPKVLNTRIEDSVFERPTNSGYAGFGIQVTRAFGPIDGVMIRGNRFRNHQMGVLVSTASNVVIENNVFESSPIGENNVTGGGVGLVSAGPEYGSSAVVRFNRFHFEAWQWYADSIVNVDGPGDWRVEDNEMYGGVQVFRAYGDKPSTVQSARNTYRPLNNGPLFVAAQPTIQTFTDTGSVRLP